MENNNGKKLSLKTVLIIIGLLASIFATAFAYVIDSNARLTNRVDALQLEVQQYRNDLASILAAIEGIRVDISWLKSALSSFLTKFK